MNSTVISLVTKRHVSIERNFEDFIDKARKTEVFGEDFDFDSNVWDVTAYLNQKSKRTGTTLVFSAWGQPRPSANISPLWMQEPFLSFSKAFVVHEYELKRKISFTRDLQALRAIGHGLDLADSVSPTSLTANIMNLALYAVKKKYKGEGVHGIATAMQRIASLLDEKAMALAPIQWRNPVMPPASRGRLGAEFEKRKKEKIPSGAILEALGHAYHNAVDAEDIVYTSMCALMLSSPDRANEVTSLLVDCESPTQGDGSPGYSLRWWPSKGALPQLKAIPGVMHDLVKDAISRIKKVTHQARVIAKWYEDQVSKTQSFPDRLYIPEHLENIRSKELISRAEISLLLWNDETLDPYTWCKLHKIETVSVEGRKILHRFADVERAVISALPKHFPYSDNTKRWKCSELLFTMPKFSNTARRQSMCLYVPMDRVDLNYRLDGKNKNSIFAKFGLNEIVDGKIVPLKISSHPFRHYLNHLAHTTGELSEIDIDLWSGRTSRGEAYNHLSSREISERAALLIGDSLSTLPAIKNNKVALYARNEFRRLGIEAGHTTDFGYCEHDFAASPCEKHEDCLDCSEQFCIKGDHIKLENLRREIEELKQLLAKAEIASQQAIYGADRWLDKQRVRMSRASELLSILENPCVPNGTPVRLTGVPTYSRIEHVRSITSEDELVRRSDSPIQYVAPVPAVEFSLLGYIEPKK